MYLIDLVVWTRSLKAVYLPFQEDMSWGWSLVAIMSTQWRWQAYCQPTGKPQHDQPQKYKWPLQTYVLYIYTSSSKLTWQWNSTFSNRTCIFKSWIFAILVFQRVYCFACTTWEHRRFAPKTVTMYFHWDVEIPAADDMFTMLEVVAFRL